MLQVSSIMATTPVSQTIRSPGASSYSTLWPSSSRKITPGPVTRCMIKPSPPKKPLPRLPVKWMDKLTPAVAARNAPFWQIMLRPGASSMAIIRPGKEEANAISAELLAVYRLMKRLSPLNTLPSTFFAPPSDDASVITSPLAHVRPPDSLIIVSPGSSWQITTGSDPPSME